MIKIEFNSPLNYGETVYYLCNNKVEKGNLIAFSLYDDKGGTSIKHIVKAESRSLPDYVTEVYTSQEELFKAIMLKEDTDYNEGEAIGK